MTQEVKDVKLSKKKVVRKKVAKKKVAKKVTKKVTKKKVTKKKVTRKKVLTEKTLTAHKMFATNDEVLQFKLGISEQNASNEKLAALKQSLVLAQMQYNNTVAKINAAIVNTESEKTLSIAEYKSWMGLISKRLGFTGGFGINTETNEVVLHPVKK